MSQTVEIFKGVRQGDAFSPKVFIATMEAIFKKMSLEERGINIHCEKLTDLRFADDVALIASTVKDMEIQLDNLNEESKKVGLKMHKGKTKYMTHLSTEDSIQVEDQDIEKVEEYKYLGRPNTQVRGLYQGRSYEKDKICNRNIPMSLRRRVYNQCILPTMTYGFETWSMYNTIFGQQTQSSPKSNGEAHATHLNP